MVDKKPIPQGDDIDLLIKVINTDTISKDNAHLIANLYGQYVGRSWSVCIKCPGSLSNALRSIKAKFPMEYLQQLKNG